MKAILNLCGTTLGGWLGWAIGAKVSIFTAFVISTIASGVALYYCNKFTRAMLP